MNLDQNIVNETSKIHPDVGDNNQQTDKKSNVEKYENNTLNCRNCNGKIKHEIINNLSSGKNSLESPVGFENSSSVSVENCSCEEQKDSESKSTSKAIQDIDATVSSRNVLDGNDFDEFLPKDMPENYKEKYVEYLKQVQSLAVPLLDSITESTLTNFRFYNDRYFENQYYTGQGKEKLRGHNDMLIRVHSNKLILVALASGNDIYRSNKKIASINFFINNRDRSQIKTKGKRKLGARQLEPDTIICKINLEGEGEPYNIRAGISGYMIEINELIKEDPNLLKTDPTGLGYLAVVSPKGPLHAYEQTVKSWGLLSEEEYVKYLADRCLLK